MLQFVFEAAPFVRGAQLIDDRKAGGFDPAPDDVFSALLVLAVDESGQILDVRPGLPGGLLGQFVVLSLDERQLEVVELLSQQGGVHGWGG